MQWMKAMVQLKNKSCPVWHNVELILAQMNGVSDGYNRTANIPIESDSILLLNLMGDLEDLESALDPKIHNMSIEEWVSSGHITGDGHCSALIKVLHGNTDLYVSHVTWNTKTITVTLSCMFYPFWQGDHEAVEEKFNNLTIKKDTRSQHQAYGDDFYILSSGLVTLETTIGNGNPALWKNVTATGEWMVVDYKLFEPKKYIKRNTLWVLEQLPGHIVSADQSHILSKQSYWPSYNVPFYPSIFNLSGAPAMVQRYGDWFTYDKTPRALIFKRDHTTVKNLHTMIRLMRYNDFKNDPLSHCNCIPPFSAENAISARNDLNPKNGTYPFSALGHRSHGGTDMKMTNAKMAQKLHFLAVNGPTYDQQPVFRWSEQDFAKDTPHYGHPDTWNFPVIGHRWLW
ncbi:phospholipase B-like 2-like [Homarus americanus]|uniref:Phospholipase B-like n=1 Tax=Homarus americanus TaxID=6706 RepID=A0A8J5TW53_HOMAM|nr:phospholipase B-like 2-like [Homarus americanus]